MEANLPVPEQLNVACGNRSKNYDVFKQKWSNYLIATGLEDKEEKQKVATLLTIIGSEALEVYNTFEWRPNEVKTVENVLKKFEKFCKPKKNVTYERFVLMTRKQSEDERIEDYVKDLRILADSCDYGYLKDSIIKDALVLGIKDNRLRENFLKQPDLNLENALEMARAAEKAREQSAQIEKDSNKEVMKISLKSDGSREGYKIVKDCKFCGKEHKMNKKFCPAYGKKCNKCELMNHFSEKCKTRTIREIESEEPSDETSEFYVY